MTKSKFKTMFNDVEIPRHIRLEDSSGPSVTVPGEAMTIQEIMARAMAGTEPDRKDAQYFDEEDLSQVNRFFGPNIDLTDIDTINARATELVGHIEEAKKRKEEDEKAQEGNAGKADDGKVSGPEPQAQPDKSKKSDEGGVE